VVEGQEYRYEWEVDGSVGDLAVDPEELFQPDTSRGRSGRLRPGLSTGMVQVKLRADGVELGALEIEVRSRKLGYEDEYRWMLRDIAEGMTELVMDRFAASEARFAPDETRDAVTLYERFAFLRSLLESEAFQVALREVLRRPHTAWATESEWVRPGSGNRADSNLIRQLSRAGIRSAWAGGPIPSVPAKLERRRTEATHDTAPNRFVKFALEHWCQVLGDIERGLAAGPSTPLAIRGQREVVAVILQLEDVLHHALFADLGTLTRFPADNQVLQKREGYRDVFRAYLEFELAARLSWRHNVDDYRAGNRDVATLYEYWGFLQLAQVVAALVGQRFDLGPLVETRDDGLNVVLQSGVETILRGEVERIGRRMDVELCFNRTYGVGSGRLSSWTQPMRPDYSLIISPAEGEIADFEPVLIHFDAKYRVAFLEELFGSGDPEENDTAKGLEAPQPVRRSTALRSDLLKMHAYRDAIRRSAGAYVLYPGTDPESDRRCYQEYHELLPGLGAFVLRPSEVGSATGVSALRRFLDDVLDHIATRLTEHERSRYWVEEVHGTWRPSLRAGLLEEISDETDVLLGFVKGVEHWNWIERRKTYNVRVEGRRGGQGAHSPLLRCQLLLLYSPAANRTALARIVSLPENVDRQAMVATGYPEPRGDYWCVQLSWVSRPTALQGLSAAAVRQHLRASGLLEGAPASLSWAQLRLLSQEVR
jgi:predicted component of viral defense system (DUF524 family)